MSIYNCLHKVAEDTTLTPEAFADFANTDEGKKVLSQVAPGELAVTAAGMGLGGLAGYLLSKRHARKADTVSRVLHSALGAAAGAGGAQLLLHSLRDSSTGMTLAEQFRLQGADIAKEELQSAVDKSIEQKDPGWFTPYSTISAGAGAVATNRLLKNVSISPKLTSKVDSKIISAVAPLLERYTNWRKGSSPLKHSFSDPAAVIKAKSDFIHNNSINKARSFAKGLRATAGGIARGGAGALLGLLVHKYVRS